MPTVSRPIPLVDIGQADDPELAGEALPEHRSG